MRGHSRTSGPGGHGTLPDDSLALLAEEDRLLIEFFNGWDDSTPPETSDTRTVVRSAFKRGTYGKLLIEHAALRLAAQADIAHVLHDTGSASLANELTRRRLEVHRALDHLDELARGVEPMGVAGSQAFAVAVGELAALMRAELSTELARVPHIKAALGDQRARLQTARWVRHHAPTHPGETDRWYSRIPLVVRIQACYDHLRGFPWASSAPIGDPDVAEPIGPEP